MESRPKKKVLMLSDHPLATSGVGLQSRWLIAGLVETGKFSFRCFGGAIKHENYDTIHVNDDFIIKPTNEFGNPDMLRVALATEQPDVLLLFTDPRFFIWVWEMEDEIHQVCPIAYWHLWDNDPWPDFNRVLYDSTDLLNCINWKTYTMINQRFPHKTNYIPHALPSKVFYELAPPQQKEARHKIFGSNAENKFICLWVNRNARRKMPSDVMAAWGMFVKNLKIKYPNAPDPLLVMHTDPRDPEGPNLFEVLKVLGLEKYVMFSIDRLEFEQLNMLYNAVDCVVNIATNEGFGLSTLEAMMCKKPIIVLKTGGLTKQVMNDDGTYNGIGLDVEVRNLVGSQVVPYIYEDHVANKTLANAYMQMYEFGPEKRKLLGLKAYEHAQKNYNINNMIRAWDAGLSDLIGLWNTDRDKIYKPWTCVTY